MAADLIVLPSPQADTEALADRTATALRTALQEKNRVNLCVTGGATPRPAYQRLAQADGIEWNRVHLFWTDERSVPPDHPESNHAMVAESLIRPASIPESNIHKMPGTCPPDQGAAIYEQALAQFFGDDLWN